MGALQVQVVNPYAGLAPNFQRMRLQNRAARVRRNALNRRRNAPNRRRIAPNGQNIAPNGGQNAPNGQPSAGQKRKIDDEPLDHESKRVMKRGQKIPNKYRLFDRKQVLNEEQMIIADCHRMTSSAQYGIHDISFYEKWLGSHGKHAIVKFLSDNMRSRECGPKSNKNLIEALQNEVRGDLHLPRLTGTSTKTVNFEDQDLSEEEKKKQFQKCRDFLVFVWFVRPLPVEKKKKHEVEGHFESAYWMHANVLKCIKADVVQMFKNVFTPFSLVSPELVEQELLPFLIHRV